MNPLAISARNFRSFPELDLELPEGCIAIVGPNGAGKSSIVNLIELCIFGPEGRSLAPYYSDDGNGEMTLELLFEHEGADFMVSRTFSPAGRGKTTLAFERSYTMVLTRESQAATQELIEKTIGLTRQTFRASAFLAQGDGAAFTEAQPRDRKAILAEVLGLEVWDVLLEAVRRDKRATEDGIAGKRALYESAEQAYLRYPEARENVNAAAVTLKEAEVAHAAVLNLHDQLAQQIARDRADRVALEPMRVIRNALQERLQSLEEQGRRALDEHLAIRAEQDALAALPDEATVGELLRAHEIQRQIHAMPYFGEVPVADECPTCGQEVHGDAAETIKAILSERLGLTAKLTGILAALEIEESDVERLLQEARTGKVRREALAIRMESAPPAVEEHKLDHARSEYVAAANLDDDARAKVRSDDDMQALEYQLQGREIAVKQAVNLVLGASEELTRAKVELERLDAQAEQMSRLKIEMHSDEQLLEDLAVLAKAYGRDGIPALIVETSAIPAIEAEASRILSELGTPYRVELRSVRELKGGGHADALDIAVVVDGATVRPYETFSGGERTRINLALRIALARLLARKVGGSRLLVIDEPEFLDEPGTIALADVLRELPDFDRVYLVSHVPTLRHAFDQTIEVTRNGDGSRIVA